jgi:NTE family protein
MELFMQRIKFLQMMKNIYHPSIRTIDKKIAYFSLGWDLENCIKGFVDAVKDELINPEVVRMHGIPLEMMADVERFRREITLLVETSVGYQDILKRNLTERQRFMARKVTTNLIRLKNPCLDYLIQHAENLTELQVRLYLPQLLVK